MLNLCSAYPGARGPVLWEVAVPSAGEGRLGRALSAEGAARCNTLGVWLPLIAFHFISMCIIYVINSIVTETCICNIRTFCLFRICVLMNDSIATYECNINFSYLETWQHGRNMTSVE